MVQCGYFIVFILLEIVSCDLATEESKKSFAKSKKSFKLEANDNFHCDLSLLPQQKKMMYYGLADHQTERAFDIYKWPKNKAGLVVVPYKISRNSQYTSEHVRLIRNAMNAVESVTCVRFKPRRREKDFVAIHSGQFCKSFLGRTGGPQEMSLNIRLCFQEGIIIHELLHALGYIHMHNRPDRDKHVKVLWENIDQRFFREFDKVDEGTFNYYGTPYDYQSIMHYGPAAFTINGARTIVPKDSTYADLIGQRNGLSVGDIRRINTKYNCHGGGGGRSNLLSAIEHVKGKSSFLAFDGLADEAEEGEEIQELFKGRKIVNIYKRELKY